MTQRLHSILFRALLPMTLCAVPVLSGCSVDDPNQAEDTESDSDALNNTMGCDYSFARPNISELHSQGYKFAVRYFSYDSGKNLTKSEANALVAHGLNVVSNWESVNTGALDGYNRGVSDAKEAEKQAKAAGAPDTRPIYFSVDFDATEGEQAAINHYMDGVASVIGRNRTGAYAGYYVIKRLFDAGKIKWGWQTYAWSGGKWDGRAQLRQVKNGLDNDEIDKDEAVAADYGQWGSANSGGGNNPHPALPSNCDIHSNGRLYCKNKADSAMYSSDNGHGSVVNHLETTNSWFKCWSTGALHAGGNHTWYYTEGDDNSKWGWVPAVDLDTASSFDKNPAAYNFKKCN